MVLKLLRSALSLLLLNSDAPLLQFQPQLQEPTITPAATKELTFQLRHLHAVSGSKNIIFHDVHPATYAPDGVQSYTLRTKPSKVHRPSSSDDFLRVQRKSKYEGITERLDWSEHEVLGPDTESRETLLELAKMTNNAYVEPKDPAWYNLSARWNETTPFGWEPDADGFRGQIFVATDHSIVVLSIKGTSAGILGGGGPTVRKDKRNDNLLFSCCCARVDWTWTTVCDCYGGGWKCDQECLEGSLIEDSLFYPIGTNLYNNLTYMYPDADIWLIGHSLGGSLASLLSVTFGVPGVAFEAPGERMAARRLHLPMPPSTQHITHIYHTADPIAMGTCNGVLSSCALGGYAMESKCHLGKTALYDTITKLKWSADVRTHRIGVIIDQLLASDWEENMPVPKAMSEEDCVDCYSWEYGRYMNQTATLPDRTTPT